MVSMVPTFDSQPQEMIVTNEMPEYVAHEDFSKMMFVFLIDCSNSMDGEKIRVTREALKSFVQSLPLGSGFALLRFGSS